MPDFRSSSHRQSVRAAFCGMAAALSAVIMLLGGVIPLAVYAVPMLCGLILLPILLEFDATTAWITYGVTAVIALLLDFDKEAAFFYGFMGYYPIVKWRFDRMRPKARRVGAKALLFTAAMALMYGLLFLIFPMHRAMEEFRERALYDAENDAYPWQNLNGRNILYYPELIPEVTKVTENADGTVTLYVNVICPDKHTDHLFAHEVTMKIDTDGSFQYLSNRIVYHSETELPSPQARMEVQRFDVEDGVGIHQ